MLTTTQQRASWRRTEYVAKMEVTLEAYLARLASLEVPPAQRAEWAAQGKKARALLVELEQAHGFVWEVRRREVDKAMLRLGTTVTT